MHPRPAAIGTAKRRRTPAVASGFTIWFTGLSGAGKTTITQRLEPALRARGLRVEILDGDVVRTNLSKGLGFSREDRDTNVRRIGFVCRLLSRNGAVAIAAAISPYRQAREDVRREIAAEAGFFEVYVKCPIEELVRRDVKGLYAKALRGEIANFTGVSDPYEEPVDPEIVVDTERESVDESVARILAGLEKAGHVAPQSVPALTGAILGGSKNGHAAGDAPYGTDAIKGLVIAGHSQFAAVETAE
ncbi:MAG TPA: adenylyl-sulfate kinase [Chloroflexota bacterium]|nr:adenylyl-sulfate kinase [Chloroflexota bacterium]